MFPSQSTPMLEKISHTRSSAAIAPYASFNASITSKSPKPPSDALSRRLRRTDLPISTMADSIACLTELCIPENNAPIRSPVGILSGKVIVGILNEPPIEAIAPPVVEPPPGEPDGIPAPGSEAGADSIEGPLAPPKPPTLPPVKPLRAPGLKEGRPSAPGIESASIFAWIAGMS